MQGRKLSAVMSGASIQLRIGINNYDISETDTKRSTIGPTA